MNTLEDVKQSTKVFLTPADIAPLMKSKPYTINLTARQRPELLGFPVTITGTRVKIPRVAFIRFCEGNDKGDHV